MDILSRMNILEKGETLYLGKSCKQTSTVLYGFQISEVKFSYAFKVKGLN